MGHGDGDSLAVWITGGVAREPTVIHLSSVVGTLKKEGGLVFFHSPQLHFSKRMKHPGDMVPATLIYLRFTRPVFKIPGSRHSPVFGLHQDP